MKKIMLLLVLVFCISVIYSQKFYVKGSIEYSLGLLNDKQVAYSTVYRWVLKIHFFSLDLKKSQNPLNDFLKSYQNYNINFNYHI
ncbi:MAG: hypothetical protein K9J13_15905 [Saprospiraceae bacterium]|nr:hypothetical protein [Saprospiraceae bacterium]